MQIGPAIVCATRAPAEDVCLLAPVHLCNDVAFLMELSLMVQRITNQAVVTRESQTGDEERTRDAGTADCRPAAPPPRCKQSQLFQQQGSGHETQGGQLHNMRPQWCRLSASASHLRDALLAAAVARDVGGWGPHVHRQHVAVRPARRQGRGHQQEDGGPEPLPLRPQLRPAQVHLSHHTRARASGGGSSSGLAVRRFCHESL